MKTLNQLKHDLIGFFKSHSQINDVKYSDEQDFNAETSLNYPAVNIIYDNSSITNKTMNHSYVFQLSDLIDDNIEGIEDEIYSDMLQVAEDFFTWLEETEGWVSPRTTTFRKFVDDTKDRTAGISFSISISIMRPMNICAKP